VPSFVTCPTRIVATPDSFGQAQQPPRRLAHLGDRARRRAEVGRVEGLNRVDHADVGPLRLQRRADDLELGLGEDLDVRRPAEPLGTELHLGDRLLTRDQQRAVRCAHLLECGQQQGGLADAWLAADEHERRGHEAAAEHAVELGDAGRDPLRILDLDVDEPEQGLGRNRRLRLGDPADDLLDERAEGGAARAAPEPAPGGGPALGAGELNGRLCHRASVRTAPDADGDALLRTSAQRKSGPAARGPLQR